MKPQKNIFEIEGITAMNSMVMMRMFHVIGSLIVSPDLICQLFQCFEMSLVKVTVFHERVSEQHKFKFSEQGNLVAIIDNEGQVIHARQDEILYIDGFIDVCAKCGIYLQFNSHHHFPDSIQEMIHDVPEYYKTDYDKTIF